MFSVTLCYAAVHVLFLFTASCGLLTSNVRARLTTADVCDDSNFSAYHRLNGSSSPALTATCLSYGSLCDFLTFFPQLTWRSHPSTDFDVKWLKRRGFMQRQAVKVGLIESYLGVKLQFGDGLQVFNNALECMVQIPNNVNVKPWYLFQV